MSWTATERYRIRVAPNGLALAQELLNTRAVGSYGGDLLADPEAGVEWLQTAARTWAGGEGIEAPDVVADGTDVAVVRAVRDGLVAMITSRGAPGPEPLPSCGAPAAEMPSSRRVPADLMVGEDGGVRLVPAGPPGEWLESAVWAQILLAQRDGTWPRLKLCREPACASAFYDMSRNNSGVWHNVRVCGNAANLRASRLRRKQRGSTLS